MKPLDQLQRLCCCELGEKLENLWWQSEFSTAVE